MFNLEQSISDWRRQMLAAGIKNPGHLDELESHLREEMEMQRMAETNAERAFHLAVQRIGRPEALQTEFGKARSTGGSRLQWLKTALLRFIGIPSPEWMEFTPAAWEILEHGRREAAGFHHDFIGTEHVLLGLLECPAGVVPGVLQRHGINKQTVRREIEKLIGPGPESRGVTSPPRTPRLKKALQLAGTEARLLGKTQAGAEHVFLGLLREGGGVAALVLKTLGVDLSTVRAEITRELGRNQRSA